MNTENRSYTTEMELEFARHLFANNRPAFLNYVKLVLTDGRTWDGNGMNVNVKLLKNQVAGMYRQHEREVLEASRPPSSSFTESR